MLLWDASVASSSLTTCYITLTGLTCNRSLRENPQIRTYTGMCFSHMRYSRKAGLQKGDANQGSHSSAFIKMRHKVYGRLGHDSCKNNTFEEMAVTDQACDRCSFITVQCGPALELTCAMCSTGHQRSRLLALDKHSTTHTRACMHTRAHAHTHTVSAMLFQRKHCTSHIQMEQEVQTRSFIATEKGESH